MTASEIKAALRKAASAEKAEIAARFFKTGKGEYGEGDRFLGVVTPQQRKIVRGYFAGRELPAFCSTRAVVLALLRGVFHEERFTGLAILTGQYCKSAAGDRKRIFDCYVANLRYVNNWDLVDSSAPYIAGDYLLDKDSSILFEWAVSSDLWVRRIAMLATFAFVKHARFDETLLLAEQLLIARKEGHDLMHKAAGWMLREVGKRDRGVLESFLERYAALMPRTALRYAIEKFSEEDRHAYMAMGR